MELLVWFFVICFAITMLWFWLSLMFNDNEIQHEIDEIELLRARLEKVDHAFHAH